MARKPFKLPPFKVEQVFVTNAESTDWGLRHLGIPDLWSKVTGKGIKVAVLDTGVATMHPDLKDAIDLTQDFSGSKTGAADLQGHGTHCAGVIGARKNDTGLIGVAPDCRLYIGKVLGGDGSGGFSQIVAGIRWALKQKVHIISMSLGAPSGNTELKKAVDDAEKAGVIIVAAAGNEGPGGNTVGYPARYPNTVGVGATDSNNKVARFSSRGKDVDIVAPGVNILSTYPPRNYAKLSGASMATPLVAGVCALILESRQKQGKPVKSVKEMLEILEGHATDIGVPGFDQDTGFGLINPAASL